MESLSNKKFQPLSEAAMKHIVGGLTTETGAGGSGSGKYSNDYMVSSGNSVEIHVPNSGDWSHYYLERAGVTKFEWTGDRER